MKNAKRILQLCLVPAMGWSLSACTGSGGGSSLEALDVSGILSLGNSSQGLEKMQGLEKDDFSTMSVNLALYKVTCATTTTPIQSATASVAADGSFTVSIVGAKGQPLSCFLVDADGDKAADFIISDSSKKDLNGNSETTSTAAFKENANLGTINFDPNAGEVTVPKTNIASVVDSTPAAAAQVFDPTGSWTIGSVDFTPPSGVKSPCAMNDQTCHGPPAGQAIYLKLWKGLVTADSSDIYGLQVWEGASSFSTCGSKIGLTSAMKTSLGVDFSANGAADSEFSFASSVPNFLDQITSQTGTVNLTDGWKMSTATTQHDLHPNCAPHDISVGGVVYSNAWVCGPDTNSLYQANLGGGCTDSTGTPVNLNNWSGIQCSTTTDANGIKTNSCSGNATVDGQSKAVTCTNKWVVTNSSYVVQPNGNFDWTSFSSSKIASGATCASIANAGSSEALKIAQLQCYSEYYYRSGMERANACLPRVDMDWSSTTSANFAVVDKIRPQGLVFFEKYAPFPDGSGGSLMTRQEHFEGVNVDGTSWVNCRVIEVGGLTVKKVSDTKLLATYQSSTITTSITKPACLAKFNGTRESYVFYLTK
ncbi:hypothetical protein [Bdellovibrio bacteriovorus]|uniref:hypothetical protein n=1 Tax=Bdellovibrio TaxID=958 RepID=UPI0035A91A23